MKHCKFWPFLITYSSEVRLEFHITSIFKIFSEDPWQWHLLPSIWQWNCHNIYLFWLIKTVTTGGANLLPRESLHNQFKHVYFTFFHIRLKLCRSFMSWWMHINPSISGLMELPGTAEGVPTGTLRSLWPGSSMKGKVTLSLGLLFKSF